MKRAIPRGEQNEIQLQQSRSLSINSRSNGRSNVQFRTKKIFVGGLSADLTEDEFKSYFEQFGRITDVVVMHDNVTRRPRGFGFITFDSENAVEDVLLKSFHGLGGKHVEVKKAVPKDVSNTAYNGRMGSGRGFDSNSYQDGNFQSYSPRYDLFQNYGHHSGYGPLSLYGVVGGYPYGAGVFSGGYPTGGYSGIGFGMTQVAPRNPWTGPAMNGVWGSPLPYIGAANFYSSYMNGSIGVTGVTANVYNGIMGRVPNGKSSQHVIIDAQLAADRTSTQIDQKKISVKSLDLDGSNGDVASKGSELKAYSNSNSS